VERYKKDWAISQELHQDMFYTADAKGDTDYPVYDTKAALTYGI
jgi:N-ethylmaleimide reductase